MDILLFFLTASEEEPPQDMKVGFPHEAGMVFLVLKTLVQRRVLMLLTKLPAEEISEDEAEVPHEVCSKDTGSGKSRDGEVNVWEHT